MAGKNGKFWSAVVAMMVVQFAFGGYAVVCSFFKDVMPNPVLFSLLRDVSTFPILLGAAGCIEGIVWPSAEDLLILCAFGAIGMYGNQVLFILGLFNAGGDVASMMQPTIPVLAAILAIVFRTEAPPVLCIADRGGARNRRVVLAGWLRVVGIVLVAAGGTIISYFTQKQTGATHAHVHAHNRTTCASSSKGGSTTVGIIMLFGNCLCCAVYIILQKKYIFNAATPLATKWKFKPVNLTAWTYLFGALFMALHTLSFVWSCPSVFTINAETLYPLLYAALLSSALAYALITYSNSVLSSSLVTAFWPVQVPVAVILNFYVNGEDLNALQGIGALLISIALLFVCYGSHLLEKSETDPGMTTLLSGTRAVSTVNSKSEISTTIKV
jgi:drug/metabolite transporter (DMT)-like permease